MGSEIPHIEMNTFQYFCIIVVCAGLALFALHHIYIAYFTDCEQCEAERFSERPPVYQPPLEICEEGDESSDDEEEDD